MRNGEGSEKAVAVIRGHLEDLRAARPSVVKAAARSPKGARTLNQILEASHRVFLREGHAGLSMRKVADEAGLALGNVNYYFDSKRALLEATLREALADYVEAHIREFDEGRDAPIDILLNVITFYISNGRESYPLFFQMWGYAASDEGARTLIRELYRPIGRFIYYLVRAARPDASDARVREIVLQLFSLEEGMKLFIGIGPDDDIALKSAEAHIRAAAEKVILS
ncbi:MAG: TetR/AcrR family transcriptional regulator [Parvularculaceae bacterium]|nr:TetR/AcrR family transcriptional regulator [Parvularculaceae bacterium]